MIDTFQNPVIDHRRFANDSLRKVWLQKELIIILWQRDYIFRLWYYVIDQSTWQSFLERSAAILNWLLSVSRHHFGLELRMSWSKLSLLPCLLVVPVLETCHATLFLIAPWRQSRGKSAENAQLWTFKFASFKCFHHHLLATLYRCWHESRDTLKEVTFFNFQQE